MNQEALIHKFAKGAVKGKASNMYIKENVLYSYGSHFPLAVRRDYGMGIQFLINGDTYSVTTSQHTNQCIRALKPNVQIPFSAIPFSALRAGRILAQYEDIPSGLTILDFRADTYHDICKVCRKDAERYEIDENATVVPDPIRHQDGTPLCDDGTTGAGKYESVHVLGAVLLTHHGRYFLSSVDGNEPWRRRAYFLCELGSPAKTVREAFEGLKPDDVREAETRGLAVKRQGDIFFVASPMETKDLKTEHVSKPRLYETSHVATEGRKVWGEWYVRGTVRHQPERRRPDHAMLRLGRDIWWRAVKNTAKQGWSAVGNVD